MRILLAVLLCPLSGLLSAAEPVKPTETLYVVEIVFFRALSPLGVPEDWSIESGRFAGTSTATTDPNDIDASTSAGGALAVRTLSSADFRLAGTEAALVRNATYRVLGHVGWVQSATPRGANLTVNLGEMGLKDPALRGTAVLEQGKYLYLGLDLAYSPADPPASLVGTAPAGNQPVTFALKQKRRVRPSERHYFDHPAFGAIAIVTAIK